MVDEKIEDKEEVSEEKVDSVGDKENENVEEKSEGKKKVKAKKKSDSFKKLKSKVANSNITAKVRENPWIAATLVFGLLALILFVGSIGSIGAISGNDAGDLLLSYFASNGVSGLTIDSIEEVSGVYQVNLLYQGASIPYYVTKDGAMAGSLSEIPTEDDSDVPATTEVPQVERPESGLFIWSYCPYGVTALEPFAEVAKLLGDSADFKVYLYYAGHGDFEVQQNKIQACIQEVDTSGAYWDYAITFADEIYDKCYGNETCDMDESVKLMDSLGIDSSAVLTCVENSGEALLDDDYAAAGELGVSGSPTLVVNGVKVSASRNAAAYKDAVCSSYIDSGVPDECGVELDSTGTTATGSC